MKNQLLSLIHNLKLRKCALIESINDLLMRFFDIDHIRHLKPYNAVDYAQSGSIAY